MNKKTPMAALCACLMLCACALADTSMSVMRGKVESYSTDRSALSRSETVQHSRSRHERLGRYLEEQSNALDAVPFDSLDQAGKIDYILLMTEIHRERQRLAHNWKQFEEIKHLLPFADAIVSLERARREAPPIDPRKAAETTTQIADAAQRIRKEIESQLSSASKPTNVHANRAARATETLRSTLRQWHNFYAGYDPVFTWWLKSPYANAEKQLDDYASFLRKKLAGYSDEETSPVIGDPIGRQALLDELEAEFIPYSPEQLIEIANREFEWCENEMRRAAADLGVATWKEALDKVSKLHMKPGDQPKLIKELAEEAVAFLEARDLITIPPLAKETWRIEMMPVERQKVNPYFTGGEVISVSYPTDDMSHEDKLMSMRGNNIHFSRATVHHELIPGHHLQGFMADRHNTHRKLFRTPFLVEGWALYWEMRLWDMGFPRSAEDRVGFLFWRSHRCARIIFSLKFHLGQMTAQEAIEFLVDRVGHERRNATAEVRRSVAGNYGPLYQAAYMLGGLQIRAMHKELVESKKLTERQFHDGILKENSIPIELIRASLSGQKLARDFRSTWKFYEPEARPSEPEVAPASQARGGAAAEGALRIYRDRIEPHWFANNTRFWYRNDLPEGRREFILVDAAAGKRQPAFDHARAAESLAKLSGKEVKGDRLPVDGLEFSPDGKIIRLRGPAESFALTLPSYEVAKIDATAPLDGGLVFDLTPRPSRRTGPETEITFVNQLDRDINLFWSGTDGERQPYGSLKPGERRAQHTYAGHVWIATAGEGQLLAVFEATDKPATASITAVPPQNQPTTRPTGRGGRGGRGAAGGLGAARTSRSPDGKFEAIVHDRKLFLRELQSNTEHPLTTDIAENETYGRDRYRQQAVNLSTNPPQVESTAPDVYWSPDSKRLIAMRTRIVPGRTVHLIESSPRDRVQPKLHSMPYAKPGDDLPIQKPDLFDVAARKKIDVSDKLFENPWDISRLRWEPDSSRFTFMFNQRGHQALRLLSVDAATGDVKPIIDETSPTFIDYSGKMFYEHHQDTSEIIWMSERDGWNHLYLYDARTGQVKNQITKGNWLVRGVDQVDREKRQIWFRAAGIREGQDPYFIHYCRVNFDGTGLVTLTEGNGTHTVTFSPDHQYLIDTWSRVDAAPVTELRRVVDGSLACRLEEADISEARAARPLTEPFVSKARDGMTDIYGVIWRPRNFDPNKKYPVIENIYAGPQGQFVPKNFRASFAQQRLADKGFIVVQIDGMGTNYRSKAFHDVCWKNLGDAGFPDRILWHKAAAAKYPQMDLTRVGLYGGSAGGQNALGGLLFHPDIYKAAFADCGCHDNRMDKIWWNEQWMGYPLDEHYAASSNVTNAHKLQGKLMLTFGELDRNVDPASTMQVVNALIRANKDFDLIIFPGAGHGAGSSPYGQRRRDEFFVRHLIETPARTAAGGTAGE